MRLRTNSYKAKVEPQRKLMNLRAPSQDDETASTSATSRSTRTGDVNDSLNSSSASEGKRVESLARAEQNILTPWTGRMKRKKLKEEIDLDDLPFSDLGLHGREKETCTLSDCLSRLLRSAGTETRRRELVWIHGRAGTGKSALASSLEDHVRRADGLFLSSKFDLNDRDEPFSAIISLCSQICWEISSLRTCNERARFSFRDICKGIKANSDQAELRLLASVLPDLTNLIGAKPTARASSIHMFVEKDAVEAAVTNAEFCHQGGGEPRLLYAFAKFFRIVNSYFCPLIIVLHDMQWADVESLELVRRLVSDNEVPCLMVVGSYRCNEVDDAHILSKLIRRLQAEDVEGLAITDIEVGNLDKKSICTILMELMSITDESRVLPLAELCYIRTLGNVFFFLAFVAMLKDEGLLEYNLGTLSWRWDVAKIRTKTTATSNVVNLMKDKMGKLEDEESEILQFAACLPKLLCSSFTRKTLFLIWKKFGTSDGAESTFNRSLETCIRERFLETYGQEDSYRFVHDQVQEAAMSLVTAPEFHMLQYDVGLTLATEFNEAELEEHIFMVTNLQNCHVLKKSRIAVLNLRAAEKAKFMSAFESASAYVSKGIEHLQGKAWSTKHQDLALQLYSLGAEVEFSAGNRAKAASYCCEVIEQECISLLSKGRAFCVLVDIQRSEVDAGDSGNRLKLAFDILRKLGCTFPSNRVTRALYISTTSRMLLRSPPTIADVSSMPLMTSKNKLTCMRLMSKTIFAGYSSGGDSQLLLMVTIRMMRWTLQHGLCDESAPAFAIFAAFLAHRFGDIEAAMAFGELSLFMTRKMETSFFESKVLFILHFFVESWSKPLHAIDKHLLESYKKGMVAGDLENAICSSIGRTSVAFLRGKNLRVVEQDLSMYANQARALKQMIHYKLALPRWQAVHNLIGLSENTTTLSGEIMEEASFTREVPDEFMLCCCRAQKSLLYAIFGEYEKGAELAMRKGDEMEDVHIFNPGCLFDAFSRSICLYATARGKTREVKCEQEADRLRSKVRSWRCKGENPNASHLLKLLDAEHEALQKNWDDAFSLYQKAGVLASRFGYLQHAGMAHERYAVALLDASPEMNRNEAKYHLEQAIKYYKEWGANQKVSKLRRSYFTILCVDVVAL